MDENLYSNTTSNIEFINCPLIFNKLKQMVVESALCLEGRETFVGAQGRQANFLFDFRPLLMDPEFLEEVSNIFWERYKSYKRVQIVALELCGLTLLGALLLKAKALNIEASGAFVRKSRKKTGRQKLIEGDLTNDPIIIIDDLVNSGSSITKMLLALNDEKKQVSELFSLMTFEQESFTKLVFDHNIRASFIFSLRDFKLRYNSKVRGGDYRHFNEFKILFEFKPHILASKTLMISQKSDPVYNGELNCLYYGAMSGHMHCIDAASGEQRWEFPMKKSHPKGIQSTPALYDGKIYFGGYDGALYCLDSKSGECLWQSIEGDFIHSSPIIDHELGVIFISLELSRPDYRGALAAYDALTGELIWQHFVKELLPCTPVYSKKLNLVATGTNDEFLLMCDSRTGEKIWSFQTRGAIKSQASFYDDDKYITFGSLDGNVYGLETLTGKLAWLFRTDSAVFSTPLVNNNKVFVGSTDRNIYVIDLIKKESVATIPSHGRIFSSPRMINGKIFIGNNNGQILEINPETSLVDAEYLLPDRICSKIGHNEIDDIFYAHTSDDRLFGFRLNTRNIEKEVTVRPEKKNLDTHPLKRSHSTMTRLYPDGSVIINHTDKIDIHFKIDGLKAEVWKLIDNTKSFETIAKIIAQLSKNPVTSIYPELYRTIDEFRSNGFLE